jgi:hypothetical protein
MAILRVKYLSGIKLKDATNTSPMRPYFESKMVELKNIDPFIVKEVKKLSKCNCKEYTYTLDTTGFQFRLQCTNSNCFTTFLKCATNLKALSGRCHGINFFKNTNKEDPLFKKLYAKYSSHMASEEQIVNTYDARNITNELNAIGVEHFGEMLLHDLKLVKKKSIYTIEHVFTPGYRKKCELISKANTLKSAKVSNVEEEYRLKGLDAFERYLYVLYSFRCAYFHGDLDPKNQNVRSNN